MIRVLAVLVVLCLAQPALAQTVTVRTGQHATFTRLVLSVPPGADIAVTRSAAGFDIRVPQADSVDPAGFFDRIPRDRIAEIRTRGGEGAVLSLILACDCVANTFRWRPDRMVVDIRDPDPAAFPVAVPALSLPVVTPREPLFAKPRIAIAARAPAAERPVADPGPAQQSPPVTPAPDLTALALPGVLLRPETNGFPPDPIATVPAHCLPPDHFQVADWGEPDVPFARQIAAARGRIALERDRDDADAILSLARLYIHFGFGAEAIATLAIDGNSSQEREVVRHLAGIMDDRAVPLLADQLPCPAEAALWAVLAVSPGDVPETIDPNGLMRAFKRLPLHLQSHLGPRLADRLAARSALDAAETALAPVLGDAGPVREDAVLAAATLDLAHARPDEASARLSDYVESAPDVSPDAMARLIALQIAEDRPIPDTQFAQLDHLLKERREDDALIRLKYRALVHADRLRDAADWLSQEVDHFESDTTEYADLLMTATTDAPDAPLFLDFAFAPEARRTSVVVANEVAARLIDMGFADRALELLRGEARRDEMAERRYLRAEAAGRAGDTLDVERHLAGLTTPRAQATRDLSRYGPTLPEAGDLPFADWRSGNWAALATSDDPLLQAASAAFLTTPVPFDLDNTPLREGERLLAASAETRAAMEELLTRFELSDTDTGSD